MNKEKYIVISGSYSKICLVDDIKKAVEIAECFISLEKDYFKKEEENKPRIFKIEKEINWKNWKEREEKQEKKEEIKVVFNLRILGEILSFLDIKKINYDIYVAQGAKKGVISGICLYKENDFLSLENAFKNSYGFCYDLNKVDEWPY